MAEIYVKKEEVKTKEKPTFAEDLKEVGITFAKASKDSLANVVSTLGITSISADESAEKAAERNPLREELKKQYTPLGAYAFIVFVLLYIPCVVAIVAMVQELGTWKWFGVTFVYQMALAWGVAFIVYQGGCLLGLGG